MSSPQPVRPSPTRMVMWLLRFTIRLPRPLARAWKRFSRGASSTRMLSTFSTSISALWLFSAFAIADSSTLRTSAAPFFGVKRSVESACPTGCPRTMSATSRHFCGEMRAYLSLAATCMTYSGAAALRSPEWPLKVRVGANSPSLCPTMFSDTSTGTCCLPLWIAIVRPTMSGRIIERRDQVLIGRRSFFSAAAWTFFARCRSTNGPFFTERGTVRSSRESVATPDDLTGGALVSAGLLTLGLPAPRRDRVRVALAGLALAAAVRMIDGVHHDTADRRADPAPALRAGLAVDDQAVLVVANLADRGAAVDVHLAHLGGAQADRGVQPLARDKLRGTSGAARELPAAAGLQLHVVHRRAQRDAAQRQRIAGLDRRLGARSDRVARGKTLGREDVAALAVRVEHEREMGAPVRVVFETLHLARHAILVATEVDHPIAMPVTTALVTRGEPALVVARARALLARRQRSNRPALMQVRAIGLDDEAPPGRGRFGLDEGHVSSSSVPLRPARQPPAPVKSMVWPATRRTYAFLKSERRPARLPKRLALPGAFTTCTESTLTSNISSTAALISGLVASGRTRNTNWFARSETNAAFSDTCGASSTDIRRSLPLMPASPRACAQHRRSRAPARAGPDSPGRRPTPGAPTRPGDCGKQDRASRRRPRSAPARCSSRARAAAPQVTVSSAPRARASRSPPAARDGRARRASRASRPGTSCG